MYLFNRAISWSCISSTVKHVIRETLPSVKESELVAMPPTYESHEEYRRIIGSLMNLELREGISKTYQEKKRISWSCRLVTCETETFVEDGLKSYLTTLKLFIEDNRKVLLGIDDLVIFNYTSEQNHRLDSKVFAFVTSINDNYYTILTKPFIGAKVGYGYLQPVSCIQAEMRPFQALRYLHRSPLKTMILHPKIVDYQLPATKTLDVNMLATKDHLNARQLEAVTKITAAVADKLPKICLIHGPPGTGKSRVIVNLIMQIIHDNRLSIGHAKQRILMCAPSNTAVDEVVLRLMKEIPKSLGTCDKSHRRLVRVGCVDKMSPLVKEVSLRRLATFYVDRKNLGYGLRDLHNFESVRRARIFHEENRLLYDADVIACTLSSSYTNRMKSLFGETDEFSVCIVDEATQSVEPETLIPLMLGVKTLILVGDTNQLPATVLSQEAKKLGLDQSLFARISKVFEHEPDNPMIKLDTQYRMPDSIALFPNRYFYDGELKNAAKVCKFPLHSYRIFNLDSTQDADKFSNDNEAKFVANLMYTLMSEVNYDGVAVLPISVGVITPYNIQKTLLGKKISERISDLKQATNIDYKVDTIDSFQGQERDVMIMSCVRSKGIGFLADRQRLCVALTRAKRSMILCGNFKTFEKNPMWKALLEDAKDRKVYINLTASSKPSVIKSFINL